MGRVTTPRPERSTRDADGPPEARYFRSNEILATLAGSVVRGQNTPQVTHVRPVRVRAAYAEPRIALHSPVGRSGQEAPNEDQQPTGHREVDDGASRGASTLKRLSVHDQARGSKLS